MFLGLQESGAVDDLEIVIIELLYAAQFSLDVAVQKLDNPSDRQRPQARPAATPARHHAPRSRATRVPS
jgi:hypothetical protein